MSPYDTNEALPEPVRNSLDEANQTKWREVFNNALSGTCDGDDGCAARVAWSAVKKEARLIEGWASTDALDKQGDVVEPDAFKRTMERYMAQGGLLIDRHSNRKIGAVIDYAFKEKDGKNGLWITAAIYKQYKVQDEVWEKIRQGKYEAFSIGADPLRIGRLCDGDKCWNTIKDLELFEISVVDKPANPEATIEGKTLAKTDTFISKGTISQESRMVDAATEKAPCSPLACLKQTLADAEVLKIVEHLKGGCTIDQKKEDKAGVGAVVPLPVKIAEGPEAPTANPMEEMKAMLKQILAALSSKQAPCGEEEEEEKPEEEMKRLLASPEGKAAFESAVKMELTKLAGAKDPATQRPTLEKHEDEGEKITKALKDRDALREMSMREVVDLAFSLEKGR